MSGKGESTSWLPEGYVLDTSEPGLWILKRVDGSEVDSSMVAAFLLERAGCSQAIPSPFLDVVRLRILTTHIKVGGVLRSSPYSAQDAERRFATSSWS